MAKTWTAQVREQDKGRRQKERRQKESARKRRAARRREWIDSPVKTAVRQLFGRR
jgi:hypothetical protein